MILGGAAVLLGSAALAHWLFSSSSDLINDIQEIGPVKRDADGENLEFEYLIKLRDLVIRYGIIRIKDIRENFIKERRKVMWDQQRYHEELELFNVEMMKSMNNLIIEVSQAIGISNDEINKSVAIY